MVHCILGDNEAPRHKGGAVGHREGRSRKWKGRAETRFLDKVLTYCHPPRVYDHTSQQLEGRQGGAPRKINGFDFLEFLCGSLLLISDIKLFSFSFSPQPKGFRRYYSSPLLIHEQFGCIKEVMPIGELGR